MSNSNEITPLTPLRRGPPQAEQGDSDNESHRSDNETNADVDDLIFNGNQQGHREGTDLFHAFSNERARRLARPRIVWGSSFKTRTRKGKKVFGFALTGHTIGVRRAINIRKLYKMNYKYTADLPREVDSNGRAHLKWDFIQPGWYLLSGDVSDIDATIASFKRNIDNGIIAANVTFRFRDIDVSRDDAYEIVAALRFREGLDSIVDVTGVN